MNEYYGECQSCGAPLEVEDDEFCEQCYSISESQAEENILRPLNFEKMTGG